MSTEQSKPLSKEEKLKERKYMGSILTALGLIVGYVLVYFIGRVICLGWPWEAYSWRWWMGTTSPSEFSYLYGWLTKGMLFWVIMIVAVVMAILGKYKFSVSFSVGFVIGLVLGELFGQSQISGIHHGWKIWGGILLFTAIMGVVLEKISKKGDFWMAKWSAIWCGVYLVGVAALVPLMWVL